MNGINVEDVRQGKWGAKALLTASHDLPDSCDLTDLADKSRFHMNFCGAPGFAAPTAPTRPWDPLFRTQAALHNAFSKRLNP